MLLAVAAPVAGRGGLGHGRAVLRAEVRAAAGWSAARAAAGKLAGLLKGSSPPPDRRHTGPSLADVPGARGTSRGVGETFGRSAVTMNQCCRAEASPSAGARGRGGPRPRDPRIR
ncbi:hypothetical protein GCM10010195_02620 [Kitasatospora griseola]|nr:hypothetical protein GCM10010195_02620 [Kitasatospora griseola]